MRGVRQHGHGSVRGEGGREKKKTGCGERGGGNDTAERGPATTARAAETGPSRTGVLTRDRETARASDRSGHARQNRRESHCTTPLSSPTTPAAPSRPETRRPPGSPRRRHRHERETDADTPMPTDGDPRAAVGPHVRRRAGRGQQPFSHRTVPSPRARSINARHGPSRPRGGEGGLPRFRQPWERCRGKGGRGDTTTQPEKHTARTTRGAGPRRGSGQSRGREREGRTRRKARVRHGKTGGDPGAHRRLPTPRPARRPSGGEESTAHAGVRTEPFPQPPPHNRSHMAPQQRQDDRQALPRVIPPRTRSGEARAAVDERANAARAGGGQGASPRETIRERPLETVRSPHPFRKIAREGNFLTEGGTDPKPRRAPATERGCMQRAHRETRRPTRGRPRGGVCGNRKVLFQGHSEHPRTGETLQPVPPESQASQSSPRESNESRETFQGQPRPLSTSPTHRRTSARGGRSPDEEGGSCPSFSPRPPSHGLLRHKREGTQPDGAPEAHQGMGSATTSSEAGT